VTARQITFLEYVAERLMGPPVSRSNGRATWPCPFHSPDERPSFNTLPPKAGCKDRFRCWSCGAWGDEFDLVKNFFDRENFGERRERLDKWRQDFERDVPADDDPVHTTPRTGRGQSRDAAPPRDDPSKIDAAFADLSLAERCVMAAAARIERRLKLIPSPLGDYCLLFEMWCVDQQRIAKIVEERERREAEEEAAFHQKVERMRQKLFGKPAVSPAVRRNGKPH
jgi:hypothetical protein